jgi:hypothetical protein
MPEHPLRLRIAQLGEDLAEQRRVEATAQVGSVDDLERRHARTLYLLQETANILAILVTAFTPTIDGATAAAQAKESTRG